MFIGQIGLNNYFNKITSTHPKINSQQKAHGVQLQAFQQRTDTVTIRSLSMQGQGETGIYKRNGNQMKVLNRVNYTPLASDERLQAEILPPSEQASYTEHDALMNQYLKQTRIEGHFEKDTFVRNSDEPVKLILPSQVSDADLESYRQQLNKNGLGKDIDWRGVKDDFWNIGVGLDNVQRLETKADYLASRYSVLKDRIKNQYTSDKQITEMDKLEHLYAHAKDEIANTYANNIGGFYENLGQSGAASDMKASVLAMVDEKTASYEKHLAQAGDYAKLNGSENQWLEQDDAYMAARLRENTSASEAKIQATDAQIKYNANDLTFAGVYAKTLSSQLENSNIVWDTARADNDLGKFLAKQNITVQASANNAAVSNEMAKLIGNVFQPFINKFLDSLDRSIDKNQEMVSKNPWMQGTVRTEHIDRNRVYLSFQNRT